MIEAVTLRSMVANSRIKGSGESRKSRRGFAAKSGGRWGLSEQVRGRFEANVEMDGFERVERNSSSQGGWARVVWTQTLHSSIYAKTAYQRARCCDIVYEQSKQLGSALHVAPSNHTWANSIGTP